MLRRTRLCGIVLIKSSLIISYALLTQLPEKLEAQEILWQKYEILLTNQTSTSANAKIEPIGMLFNELLEYSTQSSDSHDHSGEPITGVEVTIPADEKKFPVANHAFTSTPGDAHRHIGYGLYRMTVSGSELETTSFYVDYSDSDYSTAYGSGSGRSSDLFFAVDEDSRILWVPEGYPDNYDPDDIVELTDDYVIKIWDQTPVGLGSKSQNKDGFKIPAETAMPLDGTDAVVTHINPGKLFVNVEVSGDVTVSFGKTVTPEPEVTLDFTTDAILTVYGTLQAVGTLTYPITFDRSGSSGYWGGIVFDGSGSSNSTLKDCIIRNTTRAVRTDNSNVTIERNEIDTTDEYGMYIYKGSPTIYNNYIHDTDDYGIAVNDAENTYIRKNSIIACTGGVAAWGDNNVMLRGYSGNNYGLNKIDDWGNGHGVYILCGTPDLGQYSPTSQRGYNDILRESILVAT